MSAVLAGSDWLSTLESPRVTVEQMPVNLQSACSSDVAAAWLSVALMHRSWLYENAQSAAINGSLLTAFARVGQSALEVELLACLQTTEPDAGLSRRHDSLSEQVPLLRALVDELDLAVHARLGRGEESERQQPAHLRRLGTFPTVAAQVLGWWSLFGDPDTLRQLIARLVESSPADRSFLDRVDCKTIVAQQFAKLHPRYTVTAAGPDHERTFDARLVLDDGRSAEGSGRSKKLAEKAAALALLQKFEPQVLLEARPQASTDEVRRAAQTIGRQDAERYADIAASFGCRRRENFALALTHRSWTYEYSKYLDLEGGSNALLALNGRYVFDLIFRRLRLLRLLQSNTSPTLEQGSLPGIPDDEMCTLLDDLDIRPLVRMGLGQRSHGATIDIASNCVQALFGAAFIEHIHVDALERALPSPVSSWLEAAAPLVAFDPLTQLIRLGADLGFEVTEVASAERGKQHERTFESTLELMHDGMTAQIFGEHSSRRGARKAAASTALEAGAVLQGTAARDVDSTLVSFLVRAQIDHLDASQHWTRWVAEGRLGASHLTAGDNAGFEAWAAAVTATTGTWQPNQDQSADLAAYLRFAAGGGHRALFGSALDSTLEGLEALVERDEIPAEELESLRTAVAALTAAHAVHLADRSAANLADLIEEWRLVSRRAVTVSVSGDGSVHVGPRSASAIARTLFELTAALEAASDNSPLAVAVRLDAGAGTAGSITVRSEVEWTDALAGSSLLPLVLEAAPGCSVDVVSGKEVVLRVGDTAGSNWLTAPLLRVESDVYEQELARLLHDLKNELTAVSTALRPPPDADRSDRLAHQLAASRHLDSVGALTLRLRAAGVGAWQHADQGVVELDPFLRSYCADLMRSLPADVHVLPPTASTAATVATTSRVLRVILDNLVKNAVEAMPGGGQIRFEAVATETELMLEVADSGPGAPTAVLQALHDGQLARSTKRSGSGLGLASVQRLLRLLGGHLDWTGAGTGQTWQVLLPIRERDEPEQ